MVFLTWAISAGSTLTCRLPLSVSLGRDLVSHSDYFSLREEEVCFSLAIRVSSFLKFVEERYVSFGSLHKFCDASPTMLPKLTVENLHVSSSGGAVLVFPLRVKRNCGDFVDRGQLRKLPEPTIPAKGKAD